MASTGLSLGQTKGNFQLKGVILGVNKEQFYKSIKTTNGKLMRMISFGVQVDKNSVVYVNLSGMEQDSVYFSKRADAKTPGSKPTVEKVEWSKRNSFRKEGFSLIGVNTGLTKVTSDKGLEVNDTRHLAPFDACEYIKENLKDGMSVFVKGNLEFSHYEVNGNTVNAAKLMVTQLSLMGKDIDFDAKDANGNSTFVKEAVFTQAIVYTDIEKMDAEFVVGAKIVNYKTIEQGTFIVKNDKLAINFKKNLKPFTYIKIWGDIETVRNTEEVKDDSADDGWGSNNKMDRVVSPYKRVFVVTGADRESIDADTYSEKEMAKALAEVSKVEDKKKDFESDDWGNTSKDSAGSKIVKGDEDEDDDTENPW